MAGAAQGETPSPLLRCVHKCLTPSSSPSDPGPSVGSAGPKLRRSSREHTCDGWRSPEQSALRQEQHEASILSLRSARGKDATGTDAEIGLGEPVLIISPESGDADARRVRDGSIWLPPCSSLPICMDPCTYFDDTPCTTAGSTARAQHCLTRRGGGKRAGRRVASWWKNIKTQKNTAQIDLI